MKKPMRKLILSTLSALALLIYPLSLSAQNSVSLSLDVNGAAGDQAVTSLNTSADQIVAIQIFATDIQNANGLAVRFEYDASQVTYEGFDVGDVLPNAQALPEQGTNPIFVEIGIASLGGQATANSGLIGTVRFRTTAAFSGTAIRLVRAELSRGGQFETIMPNIRIALQSVATPANFSLSLDVNGVAGDQAVTSLNVSADQVVAIQIFSKDIQNANGLAVRFEYDAGQVTYEGFDVGNVLPNAQALPEHGTGFIEIGIASLGGQATTNNGLVGTIRFRTTDAFSGTAIWLVRAELSRGGQFETVTLNTRVELQFQAVSPDFDGDDVVNFADFLAFAGQFGARQGDGRYDAKYDLDSDGEIGFGDFLIFSSNFGQGASTPIGGGGEETQVTIPDANLRAAIATRLGKANDASIIRADMATMTSLTAPKKDIRDLTGLEFATGLTSLDLSQNFISDITPLSGLTDLTSLDLSYNTITDISPLSGLANLTRLRLHDNFFSDISPLSGLTNLTSLSLYDDTVITDRSVLSRLSNLSEPDIPDANLRAAIKLAMGKSSEDPITSFEMAFLSELDVTNSNISDLTGLEFATNLTSLDLSNNNILDVSALAGLTRLIELNLDRNSISDLSALSGALSNLTNLGELHLSYNSISDIAPLSGLTNLRRLRLYYNSISDIAPLSRLTNLTSLWLNGNSISDVSALSRLTRLEYLRLSSNSISNIAPLSDLTNLRGLHLSGNSISDIAPLSGLTNLREVMLSRNSISDIAPLSRLTSLISIWLNNNSISDIAPLSNLTNLESLALEDNSISDIAPLSGLTNLRGLRLSGNNISNIAPLSRLTNLRGLDLSRNSITDFSPLVANTGLGAGDRVDVTNNPSSTTSINTHIPALQSRGVDISFDSTPVSNNPTPVNIPDTNLRAVIADSLGKARGATITRGDMSTLTRLDARNANISDLTGLEFATRLKRLDLYRNSISDLLPLSDLTNLTYLNLSRNSISNIAPLSNLISLTYLNLGSNSITDLSALSVLTNLGTLWLSANSISDISPLANLTKMWQLSISSNSISDITPLSVLTNLRYLYLSSNSISDLSPLIANTGLGAGDRVNVLENPLSATSINTHIPALQSRGVDISFDPTPVSNDPTPVNIPDANLRTVIADSLDKASGATITRGDMSTLTRLDARNVNISDLTGLEFATRLKSLDLGTEWVSGEGHVNSNHISDLTPLSGLTNLTNLDLSSTGISDMSALSKLTNLTALWLSNNSISNVSVLSGLTNLRSLNLSSTGISDLSVLSKLTNLTALWLSSNSISDITPLSGLINLRSLSLSSNSISNVSVLAGLTSLTSLSLSNNSISDITPLSGLTDLRYLYLSNNTSISDISVLSGLTNLRSLNLSSNSISNITPLSSLTNLESLYLYRNSISDITPLSGLTNLRYLYLYSNSISNIAPLVANTGLGSGDRVDVRNNPLNATSINTHIPALQERGVDVRFGASKPGVEGTEPRMPYPENEDIVNGGRP